MPAGTSALSGVLLVTALFMAPAALKATTPAEAADSRLQQMLVLLVTGSKLTPYINDGTTSAKLPVQIAIAKPGRIPAFSAFGSPVSLVGDCDVRHQRRHCLIVTEKPASKGERRLSFRYPEDGVSGVATFSDEQKPKLKHLTLAES